MPGRYYANVNCHADSTGVPGQEYDHRDFDYRKVWFDVVPPANTYVALGDSFSSGEGVPPFDPKTDVPTDRCHRSTRSYPYLIDAALPSLTLTADRACSGAEIVTVIGEGKYPDEPNAQIAALTHETQIVTITVGGNDLNFRDVITDCILFSCKVKDADPVSTQLSRLKTNLPEVYKKIRKATSPSTRIYVAGYPQILPDPTAVNELACPDLTVALPSLRITASEMRWVRQTTVKLNRVIKNSVAQVDGVVYVDPRGPQSKFPGHEVCTRNPWFNGLVALAGPKKVWDYHPNRVGQRAYARLYLDYMQ